MNEKILKETLISVYRLKPGSFVYIPIPKGTEIGELQKTLKRLMKEFRQIYEKEISFSIDGEFLIFASQDDQLPKEVVISTEGTIKSVSYEEFLEGGKNAEE